MNALTSFQSNGVNLTTIQSFPDKTTSFNYSFYIEFEGHVDDSNVKQALDELRKKAIEIKIIGSFPQKQVVN